MRRILTSMVLLAWPPGASGAAPGVGEEVYPATIEAGTTEFEARYGRLTGGASDGEDGLTLEASHAFSPRLYGAVLARLNRDALGPRRLEEVAVEGIAKLGRVRGVDVAGYVEYAQGVHGSDGAEAKLLLQRRHGGFEGRLNLIIDKAFDGSATALGYAASADWSLKGDLRAGAAAFGDAGNFPRPFARSEHYAGPILKTDLDQLPVPGELEIEAGYLVALPGPARDRTQGQVRLLLSWERRF